MIEVAIVYCCTVMCFSAVIYKASAKYNKLRCNNKEKNIATLPCTHLTILFFSFNFFKNNTFYLRCGLMKNTKNRWSGTCNLLVY